MKKIFATLLSMLIIPCAFSAEQQFNNHLGGYAEFGVGTNMYYWGVLSSNGNTNGAGINGAAVSLAYGYNFTPWFALEGGAIQDFVEVNGVQTATIPYGALRFTGNFSNNWSIFGKLGVMVPVAYHFALALPMTGIGVGYAATKNVDINLQYEGAVYGIAGAGVLGLGLVYHFDN